ncbi:MAG TPA: class I SAM-dependent methyltransferase [Rhodocyclaceae bacterium]|nr:class I SAM-dependent methyltransferase [Rhodocyclaceae bacterium]
MDELTKKSIIENYRDLHRRHGSGPRVAQLSAEGQRFRFEKLADIGDLGGKSVLDIGCNLGDFLPYLNARFQAVDYTGVDIVPEIIEDARKRHPGARFVCADVLDGQFSGSFDYVFISGVFNNAIPDGTRFLKRLVEFAFRSCRLGVGFNFISTIVNFRDKELQYHDPVEVLSWCLQDLTPKVSLFHHYARCDVAVFAYKTA